MLWLAKSPTWDIPIVAETPLEARLRAKQIKRHFSDMPRESGWKITAVDPATLPLGNVRINLRDWARAWFAVLTHNAPKIKQRDFMEMAAWFQDTISAIGTDDEGD